MKHFKLSVFFIFSYICSFSQQESPIKTKSTYTLSTIIYMNEEIPCCLDSGCVITLRVKKFKKISCNNVLDGFVYIMKKGTINSYVSLDIRCSVTIDTINKTMHFIWEDSHKGYTDKESKIVKALKTNLNENYDYHKVNNLITLENKNKSSKMIISGKW